MFHQRCFPINISTKASLRNMSRLLLKTTWVFFSTILILYCNFNIKWKTFSLGSFKWDSIALDIWRNTLVVHKLWTQYVNLPDLFNDNFENIQLENICFCCPQSLIKEQYCWTYNVPTGKTKYYIQIDLIDPSNIVTRRVHFTQNIKPK